MTEPLYAFTVRAQSWSQDSYYVASSAAVHHVEVIASTEADARVEAERVLGSPGEYRYWKMSVTQGRDVRLTA